MDLSFMGSNNLLQTEVSEIWIELNWIYFNNNSNMMKLHINAVIYTA